MIKKKIRPFLKWAGGKFRIIDRITEAFPDSNRLIEPFVGSGSIFLNTDYPNYLLGETNSDLINLYQCLRTEGLVFVEYCKRFFIPENNDRQRYLSIRQQFNHCVDQYERSALFLYLNRTCFNGLCRYNSKKQFNVPYGQLKKPYFPEKEMLLFYQKAQQAEFQCGDFLETMQMAEKGDLVYCDPPYVALSETANFNNYSGYGFSEQQQLDLANKAKELANKGVTVIISNHDTQFTRCHYEGSEIISFDVQRFIAGNGLKRCLVPEVLAIFK